MAKKILITCTDSMMKQFLEPHVRNLTENGYEVEIACSEVLNRMAEVREDLGDLVRIHQLHLQRSPLALSNIKGYREVKKIIGSGKYDLIWTNEPVMGVVTRLAARNARKQGTKVMYMVHGFHFYKGAPLLNWLIFYPIERLMASKADCICTINREDYVRAQKMHAAAELLRSTDQTVLDIAGQFGYDNASKFAKAFRDIIGVSPNSYRAGIDRDSCAPDTAGES